MVSHAVIDWCVWHFWEEDMRVTRFPSSAYFRTEKVPLSRYSLACLPFMCRLHFFKIYIELGSTTMYWPSWWVYFSSASHLLLHSNTWSSTFGFVIIISNSTPTDFMTFYVTPMSGVIWNSITTYPTGSQLQRVDININYCFRYDDDGEEPDEGILESCPWWFTFTSKPFWGNDVAWVAEPFQHLDPWPVVERRSQESYDIIFGHFL